MMNLAMALMHIKKICLSAFIFARFIMTGGN